MSKATRYQDALGGVHTRLPRSKCHECGKDVAVRVGGLLREHAPAPGHASVGHWCKGSGKKARAPRRVATPKPKAPAQPDTRLDPAEALRAVRRSCYALVERNMAALAPTGATNAEILHALRDLSGGSTHGDGIYSSQTRGGASPFIAVAVPRTWLPYDPRAIRKTAAADPDRVLLLAGRELAETMRLLFGIPQPGQPAPSEDLRRYREALVEAGVVVMGPAPLRELDPLWQAALATATHDARRALEHGLFCMDGGRKAMVLVPPSLERKVRSALISR